MAMAMAMDTAMVEAITKTKTNQYLVQSFQETQQTYKRPAIRGRYALPFAARPR